MKKIAVVLFNLGGPDSLQAVKPFLINLFSDPAILRIPSPFRQILARLIAQARSKKAKDIYEKIGGRSPIYENTLQQARALEAALVTSGQVKCFIAMRYWHPFTAGAVKAVKDFGPDKIVLLPLYPQFSTTTTQSSFRMWDKVARRIKLTVHTKAIRYYPEQPGFIKAIARAIRSAYEKAQKFGNPRILFSAHGLPEKIVKAGDPYQSQCEQTVHALVKELSTNKLDWVLCYQSRVGPLRWIEPSTEIEIERAGRDKVPVIIVPIVFVSEHSETLYEIDILYRELAAQSGVPYFDRVMTVGTEPEFINGLADLVRQTIAED